MTQEEKQLLLKDLCARLPYEIIVKENDGVKENDNKLLDIDMFDGCINYDYIIENIKPYLRPMSSMTEEEFKKWRKLVDLRREPTKDIFDTAILSLKNIDEVTDWLNSHHFDYRGLIEKGLALEAPEGMYKIE